MRRHNLLICALLLAGTAHGLPEDRSKPIELEADSAEYDQTSGQSVYRGNVVVIQGTMRMTADEARVYMSDDGEFQRMEADGAPATFRYQPSVDKPEISGVGRKIEYQAAQGLVTVTGNAHFTQGGDEFTGQLVVYDVNTETVRADGQGERVRFTIQPKPGEGNP